MVVYDSQLIVFGGRAADTTKEHIPKTYELEKINGSLEILSYESKIAYSTGTTSVPVAVYLNDVWSYNIRFCRQDCTRYAETGCEDSAWTELDPGSEWGGCKMVFGAKVCSHPAERWFHGAAGFDDATMVIFGGFGPQCSDYCNDVWLFDFSDNSWTEMMELGNSETGPGKRFKFSTIVFSEIMYVFGGFRLWHGFAHENSVDNDWSSTEQYPRGGFLNDLWAYNKSKNAWTNVTEQVKCPTIASGEDAIEVECIVVWPPSRAGHAAAALGDSMFIHGGYRTFFPYPTTASAGAGRGTLSLMQTTAGYTPYPTHPYYLDDLWKFNLSTQTWTRVLSSSSSRPEPRMDHSLVAVANANVLVLVGGYISNYYFDDTWQFNVSASRWVKQKTFVHAMYPSTCTDDLQARKLAHSGNYGEFTLPSSFVLPTADAPDGYYFIKERHYGTLTFSVFADPTRSTTGATGGELVPQARRQAPGWDGCRDRSDGRTDLPSGLQWEHPSQRSAHTAVYFDEFEKLVLFGGVGFEIEQLLQSATTFASKPLGDLWAYDLGDCIKNCSLHGECLAGNCRCNDGYYGVDCSNSSCPGSYCTYNDEEQVQVCDHCCFSGYDHSAGNDSFLDGVEKLPCAADNLHYSNGVCDGFGACICREGFVGADCSIRDCGYNCSGHGYCSEEFPNARCMCDDGWFGQYCDTQMCLNNCSYPNGECVNGSCYCAMVFEPYNNTLEYLPLMGEDCSFLLPFAFAGPRLSTASTASLAIALIAAAIALQW